MSWSAPTFAPSHGMRVVGVSIPVPEPFGPQLRAWRASYGDPQARTTPAHITLLGPTEVLADEVPELVDHLAEAAGTVDPFVVVLRGTGTFRPVSDVVFVQVARGIAACEQLEQSIRKGRWGSELAFPYHPHVTIAHDVAEAALDRAFEDLADYLATFEVRGFHLYVKDGDGPWVPVQEFALRGGVVKRLLAWVQALKPYRANQRYNEVRGNLLSAGIAYYAFFSLFPAAAIAAVVFGFVLRGNPDLLESVGDALNSALPNFVKTSSQPGGLIALQAPSISLLTITGIVAAVSLVLSGIGWIGSLRDGIRAAFGAEGAPGNFVTQKLRDLGVFLGLGAAVLLSAVLTSLLGTAGGWVAEHVGLGQNDVVVYIVGLVAGYVIDVAVLVLLLRVLSGVDLPFEVLWQAALVGGLLLSVVKIFGTQLIAQATKSPLLGSVALVVGLLFWLNLIARLVLLSACWAYLDLSARQEREATPTGRDRDPSTVEHTTLRVIPPAGAAAGVAPAVSRERDRVAVVAGAVVGAGLATAAATAVRRWFTR